jgi:hypothetical protein
VDKARLATQSLRYREVIEVINQRKTQMNGSEKLLSWNEQKEIIRFLVDGSGKLQPASDVEANFSGDLLVLISRFCKDEENLERDIQNFTEARAHELDHEPLPESEIRRFRERYFGVLAADLTAGSGK